ncbi:MAG: insulinase family protein [Hyphomicrobiaceae bacterium]|nr:insulinase family protein [Hyphomicrobiaceae bacterium]
MSTEVSTLANGIRVVSHAMNHLETVSLGVWVAAGARDEVESEHGISHLLEHMAFKGTKKRTARQIAEEIESVGGELNASTSLEQTAYFARVLKGDETVALEVLADILQESQFDPQELERERDVILLEIAATRDDPEDIGYDLLAEAAFPGQPVGRTILGTTASIKGIDPATLQSFLDRHYVPERMVISAAGSVRHDQLVRHAEALFGGLARRKAPDSVPARYEGGARSYKRRFEQSHLLLGFEGPSYFADDYFAAQVFSGLFGGGMSSRLFQEVREKRGLCYTIYSSAWALADAGLFSIYSATGSEMITQLSDVVVKELEAVAQSGPTPAELARAKAQLKAGLLMSLESSSARAEQMARHVIAHGRVLAPEELIAEVDAVGEGDVRNFARRLHEGAAAVAVVGAGKSSAEHAERLAGQFRRIA